MTNKIILSAWVLTLILLSLIVWLYNWEINKLTSQVNDAKYLATNWENPYQSETKDNEKLRDILVSNICSLVPKAKEVYFLTNQHYPANLMIACPGTGRTEILEKPYIEPKNNENKN